VSNQKSEGLSNLEDITVGVVGDLMLDIYISGSSDRISPEAPVPIVMTEDQREVLGGAANVVANINSLGSKVIPFGAIGADNNGDKIMSIFSSHKICTDFISINDAMVTTTKTRVISNKQQVVRVDDEGGRMNRSTLIHNIDHFLSEIDILVISDYGKGVCVDELVVKLISKANSKNIEVLVDPKKRIANFNIYRGATWITPNIYEASQVYNDLSNENNSVEAASEYINNKYDITNVLITRSEKGLSLYNLKDKIKHYPTHAVEVFDVSGAGDTVISVIAVSVAAGFSHDQAVIFANIAAGIVVSHHGTHTINLIELNSKIEEYYEK